MLYNIPAYAHLVLSPALIHEMSMHPNVIGMKDSAGNLPVLAEYLAAASDTFRVLTGSGATVMHVDHLDPFVTDENWRPLRLRPAEYRRLAAYVAATFAAKRQVTAGYTPRDVFHAATGHYSALRTCNVWTGEALRHAGVRIGRWTPFESDVMRWIPVPETPRH